MMAMYCKDCGAELVPEARFCRECGVRLDDFIIKELEKKDSDETQIKMSYDVNIKKESEENHAVEPNNADEAVIESGVGGQLFADPDFNVFNRTETAEKTEDVEKTDDSESTAGVENIVEAENTVDAENIVETENIEKAICEEKTENAEKQSAAVTNVYQNLDDARIVNELVSINSKMDIIIELLSKQNDRISVSEEQISELKKTIKGMKIVFED